MSSTLNYSRNKRLEKDFRNYSNRIIQVNRFTAWKSRFSLWIDQKSNLSYLHQKKSVKKLYKEESEGIGLILNVKCNHRKWEKTRNSETLFHFGINNIIQNQKIFSNLWTLTCIKLAESDVFFFIAPGRMKGEGVEAQIKKISIAIVCSTLITAASCASFPHHHRTHTLPSSPSLNSFLIFNYSILLSCHPRRTEEFL